MLILRSGLSISLLFINYMSFAEENYASSNTNKYLSLPKEDSEILNDNSSTEVDNSNDEVIPSKNEIEGFEFPYVTFKQFSVGVNDSSFAELGNSAIEERYLLINSSFYFPILQLFNSHIIVAPGFDLGFNYPKNSRLDDSINKYNWYYGIGIGISSKNILEFSDTQIEPYTTFNYSQSNFYLKTFALFFKEYTHTIGSKIWLPSTLFNKMFSPVTKVFYSYSLSAGYNTIINNNWENVGGIISLAKSEYSSHQGFGFAFGFGLNNKRDAFTCALLNFNFTNANLRNFYENSDKSKQDNEIFLKKVFLSIETSY